MKKGKRAGETPIGVYVLEGKSYFWCTCGISSKQPFCDGSHKGTDFAPLKYLADQSKKIFNSPLSKYIKELCPLGTSQLNSFPSFRTI